MHIIFKALWALLLAIAILQRSISDPATYKKYETVRDAACYPCAWLQSSKSPHFPGWGSWINPDRWTKRAIASPATVIGTNKRLTEHEVLYKLGGNGPWIQRVTPGSPDSFPPPSCRVEQVHMLSRHSERYPTRTAGNRHLALVERLKALNIPLNGSLSFFNDGWTYFTDNPDRDFEQLTSTGPYAGTLGSFTTGVRLRTRYGHLLPKQPGVIMRLWASDSKRVVDTARYFAAGLLGISSDWNGNDIAEVDVIPESVDRGSDTLTPGDTCLRYIEDTEFGHDYGRNMLVRFQNVYIPPIARRLVDEEGNQAVGGFTNLEVYSMQEMCGFETLARGSSPWCDVFTSRDWDHFEYARDLIHFYRAGPGNAYAGAMGWLWLNATSHLVEAGPTVGTMFISFVHDGDIAPMLTALNIFDDPEYGHYLPVTHIAEDRVWRTSTVMPMGGRITFERLSCSNSTTGEGDLFVRMNINDGIVPLPDCHDGPGGSCPLDNFVKMVHKRRVQVGRFDDVCGTKGQETTGLSFLKQPYYQSLEDLKSFPSDLYSGGDVLQKVLKVVNQLPDS